MQQIYLRGSVRLNSFRAAAFSASETLTVRIVDASNGLILFSQDATLTTVASTFMGPWNSSVGIALQLGPDMNCAGISSIDLWVDETIPLATTETSMPTSTTTTPPIATAPPGYASFLFDFQGDICNNGQVSGILIHILDFSDRLY